MSILIKGMQVPKSCGECLSIGWHYVFECRLDDAEEGERLPNCPLIELPPHGRLIDADALIFDRCIDTYAAVAAIACAPTIIETEE